MNPPQTMVTTINNESKTTETAAEAESYFTGLTMNLSLEMAFS